MRRPVEFQLTNVASFAILIFGLILIGIIMMLIVRTQRGLLGFILAGLAAGLLVYWLREARRAVRKEFRPKGQQQAEQWTYDIIGEGDQSTLVAKVPGPESKVKVKLSGQSIEIRGGDGFKQVVHLPSRMEVTHTTYVNGVLQVKLRKLEAKARTN